MNDQRNLKAYYRELQKENENFDIPFNDLSLETLDLLECSKGFRKFLIRGAWTKGLFYLVMAAIPVSIIYGIYLKHF